MFLRYFEFILFLFIFQIFRIQVSPDHAFFATCSNDGTVKIWDCGRMEGKSVTNRLVSYSVGSLVSYYWIKVSFVFYERFCFIFCEWSSFELLDKFSFVFCEWHEISNLCTETITKYIQSFNLNWYVIFHYSTQIPSDV